MDKEKLTGYIRDTQLKITIIKNLSKVESVLRSHVPKTTDFMNPYECKHFTAILRGIGGISFCAINYGENPQRKLIQIYPDYMSEESLEVPIRALEITSYSKAGLSHRDCLGSLLGLGIQREKTGDIYIHEDRVQLIVQSTIADFVQMNLESVGREKVSVKEIPIEQVSPGQENYQEKIVYVSSLRADSLVAEIFHLSRSKVQELIKAGYLRCDYEPVTTNGRELSEGSLLSLRGYGRGYFDEVLMETKKGRLRVKVRLLQ